MHQNTSIQLDPDNRYVIHVKGSFGEIFHAFAVAVAATMHKDFNEGSVGVHEDAYSAGQTEFMKATGFGVVEDGVARKRTSLALNDTTRSVAGLLGRSKDGGPADVMAAFQERFYGYAIGAKKQAAGPIWNKYTARLRSQMVTALGMWGISYKQPAVVIWSRKSAGKIDDENGQYRDLDVNLARELVKWAHEHDRQVVFMGSHQSFVDDIIRENESPLPIVNLCDIYNSSEFRSLCSTSEWIIQDIAGSEECLIPPLNMVSAQLALQHTLAEMVPACISVGMKSGAMDGMAFMGIPSLIMDAQPPNGKNNPNVSARMKAFAMLEGVMLYRIGARINSKGPTRVPPALKGKLDECWDAAYPPSVHVLAAGMYGEAGLQDTPHVEDQEEPLPISGLQ